MTAKVVMRVTAILHDADNETTMIEKQTVTLGQKILRVVTVTLNFFGRT